MRVQRPWGDTPPPPPPPPLAVGRRVAWCLPLTQFPLHRTRLAQETAKEKSRLLEKYQKGLVATGKREQELEMQLLQERSDKKFVAAAGSCGSS